MDECMKPNGDECQSRVGEFESVTSRVHSTLDATDEMTWHARGDLNRSHAWTQTEKEELGGVRRQQHATGRNGEFGIVERKHLRGKVGEERDVERLGTKILNSERGDL